MSDNKPRIGANSIPYLHQEVAVSSEDASYPVENLLDWRPGTKFKPAFDSNLLSNGDFNLWAGGGAAAPDNWTHTADGSGTVGQGSMYWKRWKYSVKLYRKNDDTVHYLSQQVVGTAGRGWYYSAGCWVHCSIANRARLQLDDGVGTTESSYHTGDGSWQWLTVSRRTNGAAAALTLRLRVDNGLAPAYFDRALVRKGRWASGMPLGALPSVSAEPSAVYVYPCDDNLISNWYFRDWSDGSASAPDGWTLVGAGAAIAVEELYIKIDRYCAKITRAGADCHIEYSLSAADVAYMAGRYFALGCWVNATGAFSTSQIRVVVWADSYPAAGLDLGGAADTVAAGWEWISAGYSDRKIPDDVTAIKVQLKRHSDNGSTYFDGVVFKAGSALPAQTPHSKKCDYLAVHGHNLDDAGTISLHWSDDNWATSTQICTTSPSDDKSFWEAFTAVTKGAYKLLIAGGEGKVVAEIGVVAFGERLELPLECAPGLAIDHRRPVGSLVKSALGAPLGREVAFEEQRFRLIQEWIDRSDIIGDFLTWWTHASTDGLPFFVCVQLDGTDIVRYVWCPDRTQFNVPLIEGMLVRSFVLDCEGVAE
jgi:hypothetical protein